MIDPRHMTPPALVISDYDKKLWEWFISIPNRTWAINKAKEIYGPMVCGDDIPEMVLQQVYTDAIDITWSNQLIDSSMKNRLNTHLLSRIRASQLVRVERARTNAWYDGYAKDMYESTPGFYDDYAGLAVSGVTTLGSRNLRQRPVMAISIRPEFVDNTDNDHYSYRIDEDGNITSKLRQDVYDTQDWIN